MAKTQSDDADSLARWPQNPALQHDPSAHYGEGSQRAIVISGGGLAGLAWGGAYLNGLCQAGVDLANADLIVGTSAGSILGTQILAHRLSRFQFQLQLAARSRIFEFIRKDANPHPTAARARALFDDANEGSVETLTKIGHAALAAQAPSQLSLLAQILTFIGRVTWPSDALRTTACDAYTAERLVYSKASKVPLLLALGASTAVPGLMTPVKIGDRRCVDGGMGSGIHCDLAAGAKKALVIGLVYDPSQGRWTNRPGQWHDELDILTNSGTEIESRLPGEDLGDPMDATTLPLGLRLGAQQAQEDADQIRKFWNG